MQSERRVVSKRRRQVLAVLSFILGFAASAQAHGRAAAAMATAASDPAIIQSPDPQSFGSFGGAVALSADGQTALVGALDQNRAYVFVRNGDGWDLDARLPAAGPAAGAFGRVVALSADKTVAVVAATFEAACVNGLQCGAVYIYVRTSGGWLQKAHLIPPYAVDFDLEFGSALALSADGSILLVGRPEDSCISQPCLGAVFAYERAGDTWTLVDTLRGSNPQVQAFGAYISLSPDGNTALIGAPTTPCAAGPDCGEAYVFTHVGGTWSESAKLTPFLPQAEEFFGGSVGLSADGLSALIGSVQISCDGKQLRRAGLPPDGRRMDGVPGDWRQRSRDRVRAVPEPFFRWLDRSGGRAHDGMRRRSRVRSGLPNGADGGGPMVLSPVSDSVSRGCARGLHRRPFRGRGERARWSAGDFLCGRRQLRRVLFLFGALYSPEHPHPRRFGPDPSGAPSRRRRLARARQAAAVWPLSQPAGARHSVSRQCSSRNQTRSMIVAMPWPPPMHRVISAVVEVPPLELVERRAEQHRAGRAERMAERDRAAVDVDPLGIDPEAADRLQRHRGEGLVDLPEVDVADLHAGLGERLARGRGRRGEHDHRLAADGRHGADARPRLQAVRVGVALARRAARPRRRRRCRSSCRRCGRDGSRRAAG